MLAPLAMSSPSRRITTSPSLSRPFAAWVAGLALAMLGFGTYGAVQPLMPAAAATIAPQTEDIVLAEFTAPAPASASAADLPKETPPEPEVEIPPVAEIAPPLSPPEVPELLAPPPPEAAPPAPTMKPKAESPTPARRVASTPAATKGEAASDGPAVLTSPGAGRFPPPSYPAAARATRQQGTVQLRIVVEATGVPSSVEILASSGFAALDSAAVDQVRRRWRWAAGGTRLYHLPLKFEIK